MRFELEFERTFAHPPEAVWRALTEREVLARWLMENDLDAGGGGTFRLWCDDGAGNVDTYLCEVLASEPPRRLVWSWVRENRGAEGAMTVEFTLTPVADGTRLVVRHAGDLDPDAVDAFKGGWPGKLGRLGDSLAAA